jgi:hypothetical protein
VEEEEEDEGGRWSVEKGPGKYEFHENGAVSRTEA